MSSGPSAWRLLLPKWLLLHLFVIAAGIAMIWLGDWQWHQAHRHHGEIRNYAYALQWWAFTGFAVLMWYRIVRDYLRPDEVLERASPPPADEGPRYVAYAPPPAVTDDDSERVRYNAYLAALHNQGASGSAGSDRVGREG